MYQFDFPLRHANLSQPQLAAKLGISTSYLNLIEHDRRPVHEKTCTRDSMGNSVCEEIRR